MFDSGVRLGEDEVTPLAVYVNWQPGGSFAPGTQWAEHAVYNVYDNGQLLTPYGVPVNQQQSPGYASPEGSDRPWRLLGVWNVPAGDTLEVELSDGQYSLGDMLCAGDAMIHPLWPTVTCRAAGVTVNLLVPNNPVAQGDYVDWVDACQGFGVPVEGSGDRLQLNVSATIDPLYSSAPPWVSQSCGTQPWNWFDADGSSCRGQLLGRLARQRSVDGHRPAHAGRHVHRHCLAFDGSRKPAPQYLFY